LSSSLKRSFKGGGGKKEMREGGTANVVKGTFGRRGKRSSFGKNALIKA